MRLLLISTQTDYPRNLYPSAAVVKAKSRHKRGLYIDERILYTLKPFLVKKMMGGTAILSMEKGDEDPMQGGKKVLM